MARPAKSDRRKRFRQEAPKPGPSKSAPKPAKKSTSK